MNEKCIFTSKELQRHERFISNLTGSLSSSFRDIETMYSQKIVLMGNEELQGNLKESLWY